MKPGETPTNKIEVDHVVMVFEGLELANGFRSSDFGHSYTFGAA